MHSDNNEKVFETPGAVHDITVLHNAVRCGIMNLTDAECVEVLQELRKRGII